MMTTPEVYVEERCTHNCSDGVSPAASSSIPDAVHGDGVSSSGSSCVSEAAAEVEGLDDDQQLLALLDALDNLLSRRESLAKHLSKGWMEIASARYSMGPSRIDHALFSLKPCLTSTLVSVSTARDFSEATGTVGTAEQEIDSDRALHFSLRFPCKTDRGNGTAAKEKSATSMVFHSSNLRQRHTPGLENKEDINSDLEDSVDRVLVNGRDMAKTQVEDAESKSSSDVLAWFGTLVSPHLRSAQASFAEALAIVAELASAQNKILAACCQIRQGGGLL